MIERNSIKEEKKVVKVVLSGCGWWARNRTIFPYMAENPTKIQIIDIIDLIGGQKEYEDIRNDLIAINERRNLEKSITKEEFVKIGFHDNTEPKSAFHECYEEKDEFYVLKQRIYKKDVKRLIEFFDNQTNIEFRLVKEKINIPTFQGNKKFSDYLEKVANGEIEKADAIIINTPNSRHFGVASEALRQNMHVYAERPISSSRHYIGELVELARDNRLLYTGVQRRLEDTFKYMYYVVRNQVNFGTLSRINIILYSGRELDDWRKNFELVGGGIIIDEGYHLLDAACWIYSASYDSDFKSISKSDVNLELDINYDLFPELKEEESRSGKIETSAKGRIKLPN
ncbi:MAG: Gfo/Idh/MocA family protein, partial [Promethearchaeota archaeon]